VQNDARKILGQAMKKRRRRLGISQQQLAEKAGLHLTYLNGIENGRHSPGLLKIVAIARALDTTASRLLRGID
jgi:transcriptional regulator with XRE-family HTH domain